MLTIFYKNIMFVGIFSFCNTIVIVIWDIGAAGSAQHWQCWGQGFKSPMFQFMTLIRTLSDEFLMSSNLHL